MVTKITSVLYKEVKAALKDKQIPGDIARQYKIGVSTVHRIQYSKSFAHYQEHYTGRSQAQVKKSAEKKLAKEIEKVNNPKLSLKNIKENLEFQIKNTRSSIMAIIEEIEVFELISKIAIVLAVVALVLAVI